MGKQREDGGEREGENQFIDSKFCNEVELMPALPYRDVICLKNLELVLETT